ELPPHDSVPARLTADLGAAPEADTKALADRIRHERSVRPPGAATDPTRATEAGGRAPLVGRESELGALLNVVTSCFRDRRPAVLVVEGDAAAEERPLLLAIDDAHWLDHDSALALSAILRDLAAVPVALLLAVQPRWPRPELDELRARIGRDAGGLAVPLAPLGREALRSLA